MRDSSAPCLIVTRPLPQARRWSEPLSQAGYPIWVLPLIRIEPLPDPAPLQQAWRQLDGCDAVMFVSAAAVQHFFEQIPSIPSMERSLVAIVSRAWTPGPGTARALIERGWPAERIDMPASTSAQFDSEALWAQVAGQVRPGFRLLLVRGADTEGQTAGRDWLLQHVESQGGTVESLAVYRRCLPVLTPEERTRALAAAHDGSVWLFSSAEAVRNLVQVLPDADWSSARALATHPRIALVAQTCGFGRVGLARPTVDDVLRSIESVA